MSNLDNKLDRFPERRCPICDGIKSDLLFQQHFSSISGGGVMSGYSVVICQECGFAFADNIPDQPAFDRYYRELSKYEHQDMAGQASEYETRQFPGIASVIQNFIPDAQTRILEIGCANGGLLNELKQLGYQNILGIDPSPVCAQYAKQLYQVQVITNALSDLQIEQGSFDFVILVAVLEHIRDLQASLQNVYNLLSSQGRLFIEVPDVTKFASSSDAPFQEFSIEHINYFSPTSLANLMNVNGYSRVFLDQSFSKQTNTSTGYGIKAIFQKTRELKPVARIHDTESQPALISYIAQSQEAENRIHQVINNFTANGAPIIIWGVGTHTQRLLATSRLAEANIIAFVDSNPNYQGKDLNGIPIISPQALYQKSEAILISSRVYQQEIEHQIRHDLQLDNPIITLYPIDKGRSL
jgi:SAM-dependent methyltransferase